MAKLNYLYQLNEPLLQFSNKKQDVWTIRNAVEGAFIVGGIGSGKSSGSGRTLAHAYLKAGFGGLVLCAKPEEADTWRRYAKETGRSNSMLYMDGTGNKRFNFIDYELNRIDTGSSHTTPLALEAFMKLYEAMKALGGNSGTGENSFWSDSVRLLLSHSIDAVYLAQGKVPFNDLMRFIRESPTSVEEFRSEAFLSTFHYKILHDASTAVDASGDRKKIKIMEVVTAWFFSFYGMDTKTRSNIIATLESMALDFTKGDLADIFCTDTNIVPEMSHHGAVIVLDFPVKTWQRGGILAQHLFKFAWQKAIERRNKQEPLRPCFLWGDEYQNFISSYDNEFSSTARSSKACTVYLTQSIPALNDAVKGTSAKDTVDTLLNNFKTRIIHNCLDDTTKTWGADAIGKCLQWRYSEQHNHTQSEGEGEGVATGEGSHSGINTNLHGEDASGAGRAKGKNYNQTQNQNTNRNSAQGEGMSRQQVMDYHLQPSFFGESLRSGGIDNKFIVDGVVLVGGKTWDYTKKPFLIASFLQK